MKKSLSLLFLTITCLVFQGGILPKPVPKQQQNTALLDYSWYADPFYTDFTGSVTSIANELQRLRSTYPGWLFKATPDIGYTPFEWGVYSPSITAVIYSTY